MERLTGLQIFGHVVYQFPARLDRHGHHPGPLLPVPEEAGPLWQAVRQFDRHGRIGAGALLGFDCPAGRVDHHLSAA